jgi:hypothetical protein
MTGADESVEPKLGENIGDRVTALITSGLKTIPISGSIMAELVGALVPEQRLVRIESYLRYLESRISLLSNEQKEAIRTSADHVDLFEEGAYQAVRALTDERRQKIADIVAEA